MHSRVHNTDELKQRLIELFDREDLPFMVWKDYQVVFDLPEKGRVLYQQLLKKTDAALWDDHSDGGPSKLFYRNEPENLSIAIFQNRGVRVLASVLDLHRNHLQQFLPAIDEGAE
jgi:hypothetical protein